jgi:hypothetical protein
MQTVIFKSPNSSRTLLQCECGCTYLHQVYHYDPDLRNPETDPITLRCSACGTLHELTHPYESSSHPNRWTRLEHNTWAADYVPIGWERPKW